MRPGEPFSNNHGPIWTPEVWHTPPEALVAQAQAELWGDQQYLVQTALGSSGEAGGIAGGATSSYNDEEQALTPANFHSQTRGEQWRSIVGELHKTDTGDITQVH